MNQLVGGTSLDNRALPPIRMGRKFLFLFTPYRYKGLYGGRGSGKSHAAVTALVVLARQLKKDRSTCIHPMQDDALSIVCARQFQTSIAESVKKLIEDKIRSMRVRHEFRITKTSITHKTTGSRFIFIGLKDPDSVKSLEGADICFVEESQSVNETSLEKLIPTIRKPGSEIWFNWNPEDRDDPVDKMFRGGEAPPNSHIEYVSPLDNEHFRTSPLFEEMMHMARNNYARYRHVWLGDYDEQHDARIFSNVEVGRVNVPDWIPPRYGLDWTNGGSDPAAIVKLYIIEAAKTIYVAREFQGVVPLSDMPAAIRSVVEDDGDLVRADSSMPLLIESLNAAGFNLDPAVKGPGSVKAGINWLKGYRIIIDPECTHLREEARKYQWQVDKKTKKILNVPQDKFNHGWDAVRYACEDDMRNGAPEQPDSDDGVVILRFGKKR